MQWRVAIHGKGWELLCSSLNCLAAVVQLSNWLSAMELAVELVLLSNLLSSACYFTSLFFFSFLFIFFFFFNAAFNLSLRNLMRVEVYWKHWMHFSCGNYGWLCCLILWIWSMTVFNRWVPLNVSLSLFLNYFCWFSSLGVVESLTVVALACPNSITLSQRDRSLFLWSWFESLNY